MQKYIYYLLPIATMLKTKEGNGRKGRCAGPFFLLMTMEVGCGNDGGVGKHNALTMETLQQCNTLAMKGDVTMMEMQHLK
jgi:hypothetical protein